MEGNPVPQDGDDKKADRFELMTALLLGFAALGAALASLQGGQWGGRQLEAFSESNTMTTVAARDYNEAVSSQNADYAIVAQAKQLLIDAADTDDDALQQRKLRMVSYLYSQQLTWQAMKALKLPEAMWSAEQADEAGTAAPVAADGAAPVVPAAPPAPVPVAPPAADVAADDAEPTADDAAGADAAAAPAAAVAAAPDSAGEASLDAALANMLPEELLWDSIDIELHDEDSTYGDDLFSEPVAKFDQAGARFREGQTANNNGDQFDLSGVFYTVALFFAGLGLVFKSRARWALFGLGGLVFAGTSVFMAMLPWAG